MTEDNKNTITIDGISYDFDTMTEEQQNMVRHIADLDNKITTTNFKLVQLQVGRSTFYTMLKTALSSDKQE